MNPRRVFLAALLLLTFGGAPAAAGLLDNWSVEEETVAADEVRLRLTMMRIYSGGAGEARAAFLRRAEEIAREHGYREALVLKYGEGIDSRLPFAQRYAEGVIRLLR